MTVEARHSAFIRGVKAQNPIPQAFDDPLGPNQVFTLAASFIASCPSTNAALPFKAFPPLAMGGDASATIRAGSTITIMTPGYLLVAAPGGSLFASFVTVTGPVSAQVTAIDGGFTAVVPAGVTGQSYLVMTGCKDVVSDATVAAGPLIVEVGSFLPLSPTLFSCWLFANAHSARSLNKQSLSIHSRPNDGINNRIIFWGDLFGSLKKRKTCLFFSLWFLMGAERLGNFAELRREVSVCVCVCCGELVVVVILDNLVEDYKTLINFSFFLKRDIPFVLFPWDFGLQRKRNRGGAQGTSGTRLFPALALLCWCCDPVHRSLPYVNNDVHSEIDEPWAKLAA